MRKIAIITALLLTSTGAQAAAAWSIGPGNNSCATWLSSPNDTNAGANYIMGLWTGLNLKAAEGQGTVGSQTDNAGIIGEVKRACSLAPSQSLLIATMNTYKLIREREYPASK